MAIILTHHGQPSPGFNARSGSHPVHDLFLQHEVHVADQPVPLQNVKKQWRGNVVGQISNQPKGAAAGEFGEIHAQCIAGVNGYIGSSRETPFQPGSKVAVDFQNISAGNADAVIRQSLEILREAINTDAVFLVLLDGHGERIDSIATAKGPFAQCRPEVLKGEPLESLPGIRSRLEHVRLLEIRDTVQVKPEQATDAERLAGLEIRSMLLIAFAVQGTVRGFLAFASSIPRDGWDVNLHLLLKLVGTSLACGLEKISLADRLADMQERQEMALPCANDGLWDYDAQTNHTWFSPRWKAMLGFAENDIITSPDWHRMVHPEDLARVSA